MNGQNPDMKKAFESLTTYLLSKSAGAAGRPETSGVASKASATNWVIEEVCMVKECKDWPAAGRND